MLYRRSLDSCEEMRVAKETLAAEEAKAKAKTLLTTAVRNLSFAPCFDPKIGLERLKSMEKHSFLAPFQCSGDDSGVAIGHPRGGAATAGPRACGAGPLG